MLAILSLALVVLGVLFLQDTTAVGDLTPGGFVLGYVLSDIVPIVTAFLTKWVNDKAGWFAGLNNWLKRLFYVVGTVALMYLVQLLPAFFTTEDIASGRSLTPTFIGKLIYALAVTIAVAIGRKPSPPADPAAMRAGSHF